ncbi:LRR receptor-like serine/threonine-protein kinase GSO1 [Triticum urartu]|uniref:LRR receptor-like serine/threonine-protein kinase GSO1 n=1 Tax=Triticum urartu TaxID=4572 RepID=M7Z2B0_TRIUA|nr:LRR receptor-like serine/threonine-protein kinase GSO1 [Triticum urartu]
MQLAVALLCLLSISGELLMPLCEGCVEADKKALLDIQSQLSTLPHIDWEYWWDWDSSDGHCCQWLGGCIAGAGFDVWSKLRKLRSLDLSGNILSADSIQSLVAVSSLRRLSISSNDLTSPVAIQHLSTMKLDTLDLSDNAFNGTLPTGICNMENLEELHLDNSTLFGELPSCIGNLTSIRILDLSDNTLSGELPSCIGNLTSLRILDLSDNTLSGELPSCIGNLTSLRILDLSNNLFTIKFPSLSLAHLTSLVKLSLANNNLEGVLFLGSLSNSSQLVHLDLSSSGNHFQVETVTPTMSLSAQLQVMVLQNCNLSGNSAVILSFLLHQHALEAVDMSNNNLSGCFPSWLIEKNVNLQSLNLQGNSFSGILLLPSKVHDALIWLDASHNRLSKLPTGINITFPNLYFVNLSRNSFQGIFPSVLHHMDRLTFLDLSSNNFLDNIASAFNGSKSNIRSLFLSDNNFFGSFPQGILLASTSTYHLLLNDNQITGEIPDNICLGQNLTLLDVSSNKLTGSLPTCIDALENIAILNLRGNSLGGSIPLELCHLKKLVFLDMSKNNLSGPVQCLPSLQYLHLSENRLNGTFPFLLSSGTDTYTMDLRQNQFSGILPDLMHKSFPKLKVLLLKGNMFEGLIPNDICHLKYLRLLDLSHNKLSGQVPSCLSNMGVDGDLYSFLYNDSDTSVYMNDTYGFDDFGGVVGSSPVPAFFIGPDQEEFMTKSRQDKYKGSILSYMSGLDFSSNQLEGYIPKSIGDMKWLRALNFSNNCFHGPIPASLSHLSNLESLDLSHNNLTGQIPQELVELHSLEVFTVAYNNLSGPTLGRNGQFITFDESSYAGNPYLCGPPLLKSCFDAPSIPQPEEHEDDSKFANLALFSFFSVVLPDWFLDLLGCALFQEKLAMVMVFSSGQAW